MIGNQINQIPVLIGVPYKGIKEEIEKNLGAGFRFRVSEKKNDISRLLQEEEACKFIVLVGGDTTLDEVVNSGINLKEIKFAVIHRGTAGNFAGSLGVKNDSANYAFLRKISLGEARFEDYVTPTDLLRITYDSGKQLIGASSFSLGWTARICQAAEKKFEASILRKVFGKKIIYSFCTIKALHEHLAFETEIEYVTDSKAVKRVCLDNVLGIIVANGSYFAGMKNWNPEACTFDKKMEIIALENSGLLKKLRLGASIITKGCNEHVHSGQSKTSFNKYGINYLSRITSATINMSRNGKGCEILELGGATYPIMRRDEPVKVEVISEAANFLYMPYHNNSEGFTDWH
jgi:diacylglycerol kinase family enzyme